MRIDNGYKEDLARDKPDPGSYEWWYFDGLSLQGEYSFVIIFYEGNPFSSRYLNALTGRAPGSQLAHDYPAISISVYRSGIPVYYGFREVKPEQARFSRQEAKGQVEECFFHGEEYNNTLTYTVILTQTLPGGDEISGHLKFHSPAFTASLDDPVNRAENHFRHRWGLIQPVADVDGLITISGYKNETIRFSGKGYHDHNVGSEPMENSFDEWYWGRFHFADRTLIYYLMNHGGSWEQKAWLIDRTSSVEPLMKQIHLDDYSWNLFGLKSARTIRIEGERSQAHIQHDLILDNGPFYQRFQSHGVLHSRYGTDQAIGICEYIRPSRIASRLFHPLVSMRISYPDRSSHWVQKRPTLYRWTW